MTRDFSRSRSSRNGKGAGQNSSLCVTPRDFGGWLVVQLPRAHVARQLSRASKSPRQAVQ
ncbi:hypothetical protein LP2241_20051 [Pseudolactococcus piscium]|nr:hypothetical protein LP2241_20051 [Lactococcus piscium]